MTLPQLRMRLKQECLVARQVCTMQYHNLVGLPLGLQSSLASLNGERQASR